MPKFELKHDGTYVVTDIEKSMLAIITPNHHAITLPILENFEQLKESYGSIEDYKNDIGLTEEDTKLMQDLSFEKHLLFLCYEDKGIILGTYDWTGKRWNDFEGDIHTLDVQMMHITRAVINFAWAYDRECENAKHLKSIGEFCSFMMGRIDLLDCMTNMACTKKDDTSKQ